MLNIVHYHIVNIVIKDQWKRPLQAFMELDSFTIEGQKLDLFRKRKYIKNHSFQKISIIKTVIPFYIFE